MRCIGSSCTSSQPRARDCFDSTAVFQLSPGDEPVHALEERLPTGLRRDLARYLDYYNTDRAHTGRWTRPLVRDRQGQDVVVKHSPMCRQIYGIGQPKLPRCAHVPLLPVPSLT